MSTLDLIESQDMLLEAGLRLKTVIKSIAGKESNDQERFTILGQLAQKEGLPGLYDPVTGQFVKVDGSTSNTADKETDKKLAYMGLIPDNAATSTYWGKVFGTSGDKYDADLRSTSKGARDAQDLEERQLEQLKELLELVKMYTAKKAEIEKRRATAPDPKWTALINNIIPAMKAVGKSESDARQFIAKFRMDNPAITPEQVIEQIKKQGLDAMIRAYRTPTTESIDLQSSIAKQLVESFDYNFNEGEIANNIAAGAAGYGGGKVASKVLGKVIPGVATGLSWYDAYRRAKAGDLVGAGIAGLAGAVALIPGVGWIPALGLDAANIGRDLAGGGMTGKGEDDGQSTQPPQTQGNSDPKLMKLQKMIGAKPDGIYGPETKEKLMAWQKQKGIKVDGMPGPETYGKAGIKEGTEIMKKSVAESIRELQQRLEIIENDVPGNPTELSDESINPHIASSNDTQANESAEDEEAIMFNKNGKNYAMIPGPDGEAMVVDEMGNEVDGNTLEIIGKADLAEAGWTTALASLFKNFKGGLAGKGASQLRKIGPSGKSVNAGFATGAQTANKIGGVVGRNPIKTAAGAAALGGAAGYAAGGPGDSGQGTQPPQPQGSGGSGQSGGGQGTQLPPLAVDPNAEKAEQEARAKEDAELAALKAKIEALIQGLSTSQNPEVKKGIEDIKAQLGN